MNPEITKSEHKDTRESSAERIAEEKLVRLLGEDFRDFAMRFINFAEYEELVRTGNFAGGEAYSPKARKGSRSDEAPAFKDYLEHAKQKTWQEVIADETDWPQGSMSINMYNHLLDVLRKAREHVKAEDLSKENYRVRVIGEMKKIIESEIQAEEQLRQSVFSDPSLEGENLFDYIDERYDIFLMAVHLPQFQEKINSNIETLRLILGGEKLQELLSLFDTEFKGLKASLSYGAMLPASIRGKIESMSLEEKIKNQVLSLVDEVFNYKLKIESFGGEAAIVIVKKWLEDPTSVDLRLLINTVSSAQFSAHEERQYNLALILDTAVFETDGESFRGWGSIKRGESAENILGAISIMPDKESLKKLIELSSSAGVTAHPVFDSNGNVRFPKK